MVYKLEVEWTGSYPCLCFGEWIIKYNGIKKMFNEGGIIVTKELLSDLYYKIQEQDWRSGSCGGCI